jgi:endogenous inhibitor of DNA gyrase (YacG/DUF329 family)
MISVRCPICGRRIQSDDAAKTPTYPFCSDRCRLIDLGRWLGEDYRIGPVTEGEGPAQGDDEDTIP